MREYKFRLGRRKFYLWSLHWTFGIEEVEKHAIMIADNLGQLQAINDPRRLQRGESDMDATNGSHYVPGPGANADGKASPELTRRTGNDSCPSEPTQQK
jgi:hypothetical protein